MCKVREWMCLRAAQRFFSQANVRPWHSREFTCKEQTCCSGSTLAPSPPPHPVPYPAAEVLARCSLFASNLFSWKDHQHDALASMYCKVRREFPVVDRLLFLYKWKDQIAVKSAETKTLKHSDSLSWSLFPKPWDDFAAQMPGSPHLRHASGALRLGVHSYVFASFFQVKPRATLIWFLRGHQPWSTCGTSPLSMQFQLHGNLFLASNFYSRFTLEQLPLRVVEMSLDYDRCHHLILVPVAQIPRPGSWPWRLFWKHIAGSMLCLNNSSTRRPILSFRYICWVALDISSSTLLKAFWDASATFCTTAAWTVRSKPSKCSATLRAQSCASCMLKFQLPSFTLAKNMSGASFAVLSSSWSIAS